MSTLFSFGPYVFPDQSIRGDPTFAPLMSQLVVIVKVTFRNLFHPVMRGITSQT